MSEWSGLRLFSPPIVNLFGFFVFSYSDPGPRTENVFTWDEYFMGLAVLSAQRSKDPGTQVGSIVAVVV